MGFTVSIALISLDLLRIDLDTVDKVPASARRPLKHDMMGFSEIADMPEVQQVTTASQGPQPK